MSKEEKKVDELLIAENMWLSYEERELHNAVRKAIECAYNLEGKSNLDPRTIVLLKWFNKIISEDIDEIPSEQTTIKNLDLQEKLDAIKKVIPEGYLIQCHHNLPKAVAMMTEGLKTFSKEIHDLRNELTEKTDAIIAADSYLDVVRFNCSFSDVEHVIAGLRKVVN